MLRRGLIIGGLDISEYVEKDSMQVTYTPINGLSEVWTEDLTLHDDLLGYKRTFTFDLNSMEESKVLILANIFKRSSVLVKLTDPAKGTAENIYCKPSMPKAVQKMTKGNGKTFWQLSTITLDERSGHSV